MYLVLLMNYLVVIESLSVGHDFVPVSSVGEEEQDTTGEEPLEGALEELLLVERRRLEAGRVQLGISQRHLLVNVLVKDPEGQDRLRRVEQVVHRDEHGLEQGLQQT